jgi:Na+/H+-dicarboxylate symporter
MYSSPGAHLRYANYQIGTYLNISGYVVFLYSRDRFRTMTNVTGDSLGAGIVYYLSKNELPPIHNEEYGYELTTNPNKRKSVPNGTDTMTAV